MPYKLLDVVKYIVDRNVIYKQYYIKIRKIFPDNVYGQFAISKTEWEIICIHPIVF